MLPAGLRQTLSAFRHHTASAQAPSTLARRAFAASGLDTDTHDDFKPRSKAQGGAPADAQAQIAADIASQPVFVFMKGTPNQPQCGFSNMVVRVLDAYGVKYGARNVLADNSVREGIKKFSNWPTIPQVYVKGEFVGGADILHTMHESGELEKLLEPIIQQQQKAAAAK